MLALLGVLAVVGATSLAQDPPGRLALTAYIDSLAHISTHEALSRIEPRWEPPRHVFPTVVGRLRLGYYQLKAAQLSGDIEDFEQALETFQRATADDTDRAGAWYALAHANLEMRRRDFPDRRVSQRHMSGYARYYLGGREALLRSLVVEPQYSPSLELLIEIVVTEGDREQPAAVVAAMRTIEALDPADPRHLLVLGRNDRREGRLAEALVLFERYEKGGGYRGVARLEASRTLVSLNLIDEAVAAYWSGLEHLGELGRALYRTDLSWVAVPSEIAEFDRLKADSVTAWVANFWADRDARGVRPPGERLREHLRRWVLVHRQFRVSRPERRAVHNPPWLFERPAACTDSRDSGLDGVDFPNPSRPKDLRGWEPFLDHRAPIYMRHGEPIRRVWSSGRDREGEVSPLSVADVPGEVSRPGEVPQTDARAVDEAATQRRWETWAYWINGEPRFFAFAGSMALGTGAPTTLSYKAPIERYAYAMELLVEYVGGLDDDVRRDIARLRHDALSREAGLRRALPSSRCSKSYQRWLARAQADRDLSVRTDGHVLFFPSNLLPTVQVYGLPGLIPTDYGTILVVYAVPIANLGIAEPAESLNAASIRLRVSAVDSSSGHRLWTDTTRVVQIPQVVSPESHLSGFLEIPAPEGTYEVRVAVQAADSSTGNTIEWPTHVDTWVASDDLELSDVVTGGPDGGMLFWFGREPVLLNPLDAFLSQTTVEAFYVQGGLRPGERYRTTVTVSKWDEDDSLSSLSFEETAEHGIETKRRGIALQDLEAGRYRLTLTLEEVGTNRRVRRHRIIKVVEPE